MTWTYSGDPSANNRDLVRFLVHDTDTTAQLLTDEEIAGLVTIEGSARGAAVLAAGSLAARFGRKASMSVGDLSIDYGSIATFYNNLVASLRRELATTSARPYAGGQSISDKESKEDDDDRVSPAFKRNMHDRDRRMRDDLTKDCD
jgi:hypothetical protein